MMGVTRFMFGWVSYSMFAIFMGRNLTQLNYFISFEIRY